MQIDRDLNPQWFVAEFLTKTVKGFYMRFFSRGTIGFKRVVENALKGSTYNSKEYIGATQLVQEQLQEYMSQGFRVDFGDNFITLWPNIVGSIKDTTDPSTGKLIPADPKKLKSSNAETRIGCTVAKTFLSGLTGKMHWKKVTKNGIELAEEDDATVDPNDNPDDIPTVDTSTGTVDTSTNNTNDGDDGLGG